ncbi:MAG TPA: hypothetical protein VI298_18480 [Geobacteraceae bacterium]
MTPMDSIRVHVFRDSHDPFTQLLDQNDIEYYGVALNSCGPMNAGEMLEIVKTVGNAALWPSLATVIVAFIRARKSRKVMITTKDNKIFHAEGYSVEEISQILHEARSITAIDTKKPEITSDTVAPSQQP